MNKVQSSLELLRIMATKFTEEADKIKHKERLAQRARTKL